MNETLLSLPMVAQCGDQLRLLTIMKTLPEAILDLTQANQHAEATSRIIDQSKPQRDSERHTI